MWGETPSPIKEVYRRDNYWQVVTEAGTGFAFPVAKTKGRPNPKVGDEIICHTVNGSTIRGVTLRGELLYMKTDEELEAERLEWTRKHEERQKKEFERDRAKLNAQYDALPIEFQRRVSWFRAHNPDFRWEFESYELSCCVDAMKIVETLATAAKIKRFAKAGHKKQQELVPNLAYDQHSGNSFGMAVQLARLYVQNPLWVFLEHGALTPLVGCEDYGCAHPRPADVIASLPEETLGET